MNKSWFYSIFLDLTCDRAAAQLLADAGAWLRFYSTAQVNAASLLEERFKRQSTAEISSEFWIC